MNALDDSSPETLANGLQQRISFMSGSKAFRQSSMSPELAYGRHRGPARLKSRQAAVAVSLYKTDNGTWTIPLTRRPDSLRHHGGQICFPGGRIEPGETPLVAACREFTEELGIAPVITNICGQLPLQYVYGSDNEVTPVVMVISRPSTPWQPDPVEVSEIIEIPLSEILNDPVLETQQKRKTIHFAPQATRYDAEQPLATHGEFVFSAPAYAIGEIRIWGATAIILSHLAQCLLHLEPGSDLA